MSSQPIPAPPPNASATQRGLMTAADKIALDAAVTDVATLQGDVSTLQGDVSTLQGDVSTLQGNVSTLQGASHAAVTLGAVGSSPNANGASLSGQVLTLQPADATNPGAVTTGAQTFAGAKTFNGLITSGVASGSDAILLATGARLKLGGGTTDYLVSDGASTIITPGALQSVSIQGSGGVAGVVQVVGGLTIATDKALYFNGSTASKLIYWDGSKFNIIGGNALSDSKLLATGGIGVGNSASASSLGSVVKKMQVFDASGSSLGFVAIYDAIT